MQDNDFIFLQKFEHRKKYYVGIYWQDTEQAVIAQIDGPYTWALSLYRPYYNRFILCRKAPLSEDVATELVNGIFNKIKQKPRKGLDKICLEQGWDIVRDSKDLSDEEFYFTKTWITDLND